METPVATGVTVKGVDPDGAVVPVPVRMTDCGEFEALPVTVKVAVLATALVGKKVTVIVQFAPTARLAGHPLESLVKSPFPEIVIWLIVSAEDEDELVSVTGWLTLEFTV
jgi:hypothetical protein